MKMANLRSLRQLFTYSRLYCLRKRLNAQQFIIRSQSTNSEVLADDSTSQRDYQHIPVMVKEVLDILQPTRGQVMLDMTFGAGGHARELLKQAPDLKLFCLDRDPVAYERAQELAKEQPQVTPLNGKFSDIYRLMQGCGYGDSSLDGVLFDVGASSLQFDDTTAGFSLSRDGPLDMRMDRGSVDEITAEDVVNNMDENNLYKILKRYGEEKRARVISRAIVDSRYAFGRIKTTSQLAKVVASVFEGAIERDKLFRHAHVATRTFQALRIFVNNELNELYNGLAIVHRLLKPSAPCVAISFHSLEDRIIKRNFLGIDMDTRLNMSVTQQHRGGVKGYLEQDMLRLLHKDWRPIIKGAQLPTETEINDNPRARSAKLRAACKI